MSDEERRRRLAELLRRDHAAGYVPPETAGAPPEPPAIGGIPKADWAAHGLVPPPADINEAKERDAATRERVADFAYEVSPLKAGWDMGMAMGAGDWIGAAGYAAMALAPPGRAAKPAAKALGKAAGGGRGGEIPYHLRPGVEAPTKNNPRGLAMDTASRHARDREMGFDETVYHGTASPAIKRFDMRYAGQHTRNPTALTGISVSPQPEVANLYAKNAAERQAERAKEAVALGELTERQAASVRAAPNVLPLRLASGKQGTIRLSGDELSNEVAGAIQDAWRAGYDSVRIVHPQGKKLDPFYGSIAQDAPPVEIVVRRPEQLRSAFATFDPQYTGPELLRGAPPYALPLAGGAAAGAGMFGLGTDAPPVY